MKDLLNGKYRVLNYLKIESCVNLIRDLYRHWPRKLSRGFQENLKWNIICGYTLYKRIYTFNNISSPFSPFCFVIFAFKKTLFFIYFWKFKGALQFTPSMDPSMLILYSCIHVKVGSLCSIVQKLWKVQTLSVT